MKARPEEVYWAIVGRIPGGEAHVYFSSKPTTQKRAIQSAKLTEYRGNLADMSYVRARLGTDFEVLAAVASRSPQALGGYEHRLPKAAI